MRKILLCALLLSSPMALADNPAAPSTAPDMRTSAFEIRDMLVAVFKAQKATPAQWDDIEAKMSTFQKQFGTLGESGEIEAELRNMELQIMRKIGDRDRYEALLQTLSTNPAEEVAGMARDALATEKKVSELKAKPMELKFTDVNGKEVDLAKMRGKVVLLDFWATWCPACIEETPDVVAAYKKYHSKGLEVVGISLDQDKDKMLAYTKQNGMKWPQYFDGEGWDNKISASYNIHLIPVLWLIDKKGMLAITEAGDNLDGQIAGLLASP